MRVFAYRATAAGIQRIASERGQPIAAIEAVETRTALVKPPVALVQPAKLVAGLCVKEAVVVEFIPRTTAQKIIADTAHKHGLTYGDIISKSRRRHFVKARTEAIWALKDWKPCLSLHQLGRLMGGRDHTTMLHALQKRSQA
jgi:chromosomal replication initiation ATPase DnaA